MARVANDTRTKAVRSQAYTTDDINKNNTHLREGDEGIERLRNEPDDAFDARKVDDYQTQLNTEGARAISKAGQMLLWYIADLGIATPVAYTDAEVDAIDIDIRTSDDGL